jgi:CxxC-x17-CxxC domain-containing protein
MKNFQQRDTRGGGFRGDRGDRGGKPSFQNKERGGKEMPLHKATCSECHKSCEVPFRPTGDKPVFCRDCFALKRGEDTGTRNERSNRPGPTHHEKTMGRTDFSRPESKPAYSQAPVQNNQEMKSQLAEISSKLDKLISTIERMSVSKKEAPVEIVASKKLVVTPVAKVMVAKKPAPTKKAAVTPSTVAKKGAEKKVVVKKVTVSPASKKVAAKVVVKKVTLAKKAVTRNVPTKKAVTKKAK